MGNPVLAVPCGGAEPHFFFCSHGQGHLFLNQDNQELTGVC